MNVQLSHPYQRRKTLHKPKLVRSTVLFLLGACLFAVATVTTPVLSRLSFGAVWQSGLAQETQPVRDPVLRILLRTDRSCYLTGQAVRARLELVNVSPKAQVVLKTLDFYGDGGFMGVWPIINGEPDNHWGGVWLDERHLFPPQANQFTTLQPNESTLTWLNNFWDFTRGVPYRDGAPPGTYTLAVRYRNWFKGPARFVLGNDNKSMDVIFTDFNAWTGVLYSEPITIRIVDWPWDCRPSTITAVHPTPAASPTWSW